VVSIDFVELDHIGLLKFEFVDDFLGDGDVEGSAYLADFALQSEWTLSLGHSYYSSYATVL